MGSTTAVPSRSAYLRWAAAFLASLTAAALVVVGPAGDGSASAVSVARKSCAKGGPCEIGSKGPGGGLVFMTPKTKGNRTGKYFEAAPAGWSGTAMDPYGAWCSETEASVPPPGATGTAIGTGKRNTEAMVAVCSTGAAAQAAAYTGRGLTDWFLPAKAELNQMFKRLRNKGGFQISGYGYWSSSEIDPSYAWALDFMDGRWGRTWKPGPLFFRPVRAF